MLFSTLFAAASAALLASAAPAPATTSLAADPPATPGTALDNAYWLIDINAARENINGIPAVKVGNATLAQQATAWTQTCTYGRETTPSGYIQAVTYVNGTGVETYRTVQKEAVANWEAQGTYSLISYWEASQLGCGLTYCASINTGANPVYPLIEPQACTFKTM
ncbi:hypothetical protein JCM10213_001151 [Rhodosporidiobolus nylandii]